MMLTIFLLIIVFTGVVLSACRFHLENAGAPRFDDPLRVCFVRWSDANPEKQHRLQPFGGYLSEFQSFAGFRPPMLVEAGNHFGTDQYFPIFVADVTEVLFK